MLPQLSTMRRCAAQCLRARAGSLLLGLRPRRSCEGTCGCATSRLLLLEERHAGAQLPSTDVILRRADAALSGAEASVRPGGGVDGAAAQWRTAVNG
jgi:hypothetical protein